MLPIGGVLMAIFVGHVMKQSDVMDSMDLKGKSYTAWMWVLRWVSPVAVSIVFIFGMYNIFAG